MRIVYVYVLYILNSVNVDLRYCKVIVIAVSNPGVL